MLSMSMTFIALIFVVFLCVGFIVFIVVFAIKSQFVKVATGSEAMPGKRGIAVSSISESGGTALIQGEIWNVVSDVSIKKGEKLIVLETKGMELVVKPYRTDKEV